MKTHLLSAILLASAVSISPSVGAAVLTQTLGDQDFADGDAPGSGIFTGANGGDPAPFHPLPGSTDIFGPNFAVSWPFSGPPISNVTSASILIGLYEGDSSASGDQVKTFTLNSTIDL